MTSEHQFLFEVVRWRFDALDILNDLPLFFDVNEVSDVPADFHSVDDEVERLL
jgi:hypothetical protein